MNIFKAIKLYNKINKAWKKSKKLIDSKQGIVEDVKKGFASLQSDLFFLANVLPDFKEIYEEIKGIIESEIK